MSMSETDWVDFNNHPPEGQLNYLYHPGRKPEANLVTVVRDIRGTIVAGTTVDGKPIAPSSVASTGPISGTTGTFSGNVGVKTVAPDRDFQVIGVIEAANTSGAARKSIAMYVVGTYTVLQAYDLAGGPMQLSIQPLGGTTLIGGTTDTGETLQVYGNIKVSGVIKIPQTTFAGLGSAATAGNGARGYITDSFLSFSGTNIGLGTSGGGGNHCPVVVVNGAWVVG